ncbi:MAG: GatB/YqeY domain-containing protein [Chitinophagales bacterium]|nr:GatB/YqeY domain-containing protein [Chitinophagales bacterium]
MNLEERINNDLRQAMLKKDEAALRGVRAIKSAILLAKTEKDSSKEINEETGIKLLQKLVKQRKDSLEIYDREKREDLAKKESEEIEVIERYLPQQINNEELTIILKKIIAVAEAKTSRDIGKVMGIANKELAGKADGKTISVIVKQLLTE